MVCHLPPRFYHMMRGDERNSRLATIDFARYFLLPSPFMKINMSSMCNQFQLFGISIGISAMVADWRLCLSLWTEWLCKVESLVILGSLVDWLNRNGHLEEGLWPIPGEAAGEVVQLGPGVRVGVDWDRSSSILVVKGGHGVPFSLFSLNWKARRTGGERDEKTVSQS